MSTADTSFKGRLLPGLKRLFVAALIATLGLAAAWILLTGKPKPEPSNVVEAPRPLISVIDAEPRAVTIPVRSQGTVEAVRRISLVAQVGGKVDTVSDGFVDGAFFETGDELLRIESADYDFAIARAESQVAAAEQRLAEERGRNRQAKREWRDLGSTEANALFLREPQMKAAKAALEAAKADLAAAKLALERSVIRAPFDGRIEAKRVDIGQYLAPGVTVADVYAVDRLEVRLPLTNSQVAQLSLRVQRQALLDYPVVLKSVYGGREELWQARIRRIEASVDRQSRSVTAIAEIDLANSASSDQHLLSPGMFVQAEIPTPPIAGVSRLPASALRSDNSVLVVGADGRLQRRIVDVQRRSEEWSWVTGLQEGEQIVAVQTGVLVAGMAVDIAESPNTKGVN